MKDTTAPHPLVILVEDEADARAMYLELIQCLPCRCVAAGCATEARLLLEEHTAPAVIAADLQLPDINGMTLLREFRERAPTAKNLLFTGHPAIASVLKALEDGILDRFITKPVPAERFVRTIQSLLRMSKRVCTR